MTSSYRSKRDCDLSSDDEEPRQELPLSSSEPDDEVFSNKKMRMSNGTSDGTGVTDVSMGGADDVDAATLIMSPSPTAVSPTGAEPAAADAAAGKLKGDPWSSIAHEQNSEEIAKHLETVVSTDFGHVERGPESFRKPTARPRFNKESSENDSADPPSAKCKVVANEIDNCTIDRTENNGNAGRHQAAGNNNNNNQQHWPNNRNHNGPNKRKIARPAKLFGGARNVTILPVGSSRRLNMKRVLHENMSNAEVAEEVAFRLWEKKRYLVSEVVNIIGVGKAIELMKKVEAIELDGGIQVLKGTRRRSPGGTFFFLLQTEPEVDKNAIKELFDADNKMEKGKLANPESKRLSNARKRKRREEKKQLQLLAAAELDKVGGSMETGGPAGTCPLSSGVHNETPIEAAAAETTTTTASLEEEEDDLHLAAGSSNDVGGSPNHEEPNVVPHQQQQQLPPQQQQQLC